MFIISLFAVGVAHAEDGMMGGGNQPTTTMMNPTWLRIMPVMGSDTPKMMGGDKEHRPMMGSSTQVCRKFSRGLALGLRGDDVKELQEMLRENGYLSASSTGYFGKLTKEAVVKFQKEGGVNPTGYFGELSRKQHDKRCGEGRGMGKREDEKGDDNKGPWMGSSTLSRPCMTSATTTGCEHSNAFPWKMGSSTMPCETKFDPSTGRPCKPKDDDHNWSSGTPPMMPPPPPATTTVEQSSPCLGKTEGSSCQNGNGMCKYALGGDVLLFCVPVR